MCDARDLGAHPEIRAPHTGAPTVYVYERYPGGVGMSARLFEIAGTVLGAAHDLVSQCGCESGCPSCVGPALEVGGKGKAVATHPFELAALAPVGCPPISSPYAPGSRQLRPARRGSCLHPPPQDHRSLMGEGGVGATARRAGCRRTAPRS